jgi:hypothetical protein
MVWYRRIAWGIAGLLWFFWLGYEDRGLSPVLIVASAIALAIAVEQLFRREANGHSPIKASIAGAIIGGLVPAISVVLVLLKTSLHQHAIADFSENDIAILLRRTPFWFVGGFLFGAAFAIWGSTKNRLQ